MIQKIIKVGNSAAVSIPKKLLEGKNLKIGDLAEVDIQPKKVQNKMSLTPEFLKWVDKYIASNRPALNELASK